MPAALEELDLKLLPIFDEVPADLLEPLRSDMVRYYSHDDVIFAQGEEADTLVVLLHGHVRIIASRVFLLPRGPYAVLGEQAFINETTRSATVIAQGVVKALVLPRVLVGRLMTNATFVRNLLRVVSDKLREATGERVFHYRIEQLLFSEFRAHLSPELTHRLLATGLAYGEPQYIDAIILFSDIRSFTQRSADMPRDEIAGQLSPYLDAVVDVVHRHDGMVDKFIGDAVMAIWGFAPSEADIPAQALACAEEMIAVASTMRFGGEPITIGIGLNAGRVFIGNVGGPGKRQFTVIGTPVNLAARFEAETKELDARMVVGQDFYDRLSPEVQARFAAHPNHTIKGAESQTLYSYDPATPQMGG